MKVLDNGNNPSDTLYAIQVSTDNFVTNTKFVQDDNSLGDTLGNEDWQTYTAWGDTTGINVIGLLPSTTYYFRASARQGNFTQSGYGPTSSVATVAPQMSFDIDISPTDSETNPPYILDIGDLSSSSVTTASDKLWIDMSSNSENGSTVYIYSDGTGLFSSKTNYTITSLSGNLASLDEGFGGRGESTTQSSGGPFIKIAPYDGSNDAIGLIDTTIRP